MNNNNEELSNEELIRVRNALDALQTHNQQPTQSAWEAIMEDTQNQKQRTNKRIQLFSVAAATVLIVAIGATVLTVASRNSREIETINKGKNNPLQTSTPISKEESLLEGTISIETDYTLDDTGHKRPTAIRALDPITGKKLFDFPNDDRDGYPEYFYLRFSHIANGRLNISRYSQCDTPSGISNVILATGKSTFTDHNARIYSPDGKKYAEIKPSCDSTPSSAIVDATSGTRRELKPEMIDNTMTYIEDIKWIDNDRFVFMTTPQSNYYLGDTRKVISIADAPKLSFIDEQSLLCDVKVFNGVDYALVFSGSNQNKVSVFNMDTEKEIWSYSTGGSFIATSPIYGLHFSQTPYRVVGAHGDNGVVTGFLYDQTTGTVLTPKGDGLIPKN